MVDPLPQPLVVAFVLGVTPGKWASIWHERMARHPLTLSPASQAEALQSLVEGRADVALVRRPVSEESFSSITLYEERAFVVVPKDHAIEAVDSVVRADLDDENVLDATDPAAAIELVAANVGVAVVPQSIARALSRRDVVSRPLTDEPTTQVALVWPRDLSTPLIEEFIGIVRGRSARSSRGEPTPPTPKPVKPRPAKPQQQKPTRQPITKSKRRSR